MDVQVFAISTDSKFVHKHWNEGELSEMIEGGFPFPMLSDQTGALGKPYDVYDETAGVDIRGTVIISPEGVVQLISVNIPPLGREPVEIVRCVCALRESAACGKVMPAGWKLGMETINPVPENSGQIWKSHGKNKK